jgi:hypothetical protein
MLTFDLERQLRGAYLRMQAVLAEVVAVERNVQRAKRRLAVQCFEQGLSDPYAACADADEGALIPRLFRCAFRSIAIWLINSAGLGKLLMVAPSEARSHSLRLAGLKLEFSAVQCGAV